MIPNIPNHWITIDLEKLFQWSNGEGLIKKDMKDGQFLVYGGNGVTGKHNAYLTKNESIVIGRVGAYCGNVHLSQKNSWITDNAIFSKWNSSYVDLKFSFYYLSNIKLNRLAGGSGQPYLSQQILNNLLFPLPSLNEQKRIVSKIEELFTKIDVGIKYLNKTQILLKQFRQSVLKSAFTGKLSEKWRKKNVNENDSSVLLLRNICKSILGNNIQDDSICFKSNEINIPSQWILTKLGNIAKINPKYNSDLSDDTEVSFLPMKCITEETGHIDLSVIKQLKEVKKGYTRFIENDIIFAKITPCMENGKIAIANNLKNGIGFGSTEFHIIRLNSQLPRKYYFYYLLQENLRKDARRHMKGTAGQLRVPPTYMNDILIPFPSLKEQFVIIDEIEKALSVINNIEINIKICFYKKEALKQTILKNAFEGKLVPPDHSNESIQHILNRIKDEKLNNKKENSKISKESLNDSKQMRLC